MPEQELRTSLRELLVALCDPSLDEDTRQLMVRVVLELEKLLEAASLRKRAQLTFVQGQAGYP